MENPISSSPVVCVCQLCSKSYSFNININVTYIHIYVYTLCIAQVGSSNYLIQNICMLHSCQDVILLIVNKLFTYYPSLFLYKCIHVFALLVK